MSFRDVGLYVPTTNVWDVSQIYETEVTSPEFKELLVRLYQNINNIALALNLKDSAYYVEEEFVNGQTFPAVNPAASSSFGRQAYRKVFQFGALPNAATKTLAHGLTVNNTLNFTRIYGCASDKTGFNYIPLPYSSTVAANNIELRLNTTNIVVTTGSNRSAFTQAWIIVEFLKE